jgi:hypothetical protein
MSDLRGWQFFFDVTLALNFGGSVFLFLAVGVLWNRTSRWIPCVFAMGATAQFLYFLTHWPWTPEGVTSSVIIGILGTLSVMGLYSLLVILLPFAIWRMALQIRDMKAQIDNLPPPSEEDIAGNPVEDSNR